MGIFQKFQLLKLRIKKKCNFFQKFKKTSDIEISKNSENFNRKNPQR